MITTINEFKRFLESNQLYSVNDVIEHVTDITPHTGDVPDYFFEIMKRDNLKYELRTVPVQDILNTDESVKEYVMSGEDRYADDDEEYVPYPEEVDYPIVIHNNEVIDGYSRLSYHYHNDIDKIQAYVSVNDINENNISPLRFKDSDLTDIIDFVDELLYNSKNIDITEKIAGQHLTVNIKNGFVTVNNKDSLLYNGDEKDARKTRYGSEITRALIKYLQTNKLSDQVWAFEIVNPKFNHDYIKYSNQDIVFIEYTGTLSDTVANELRKMISVRLLTKSDIKINIDKNSAFNGFKTKWESGLKRKYENIDGSKKSRYYYKAINELKYEIGELLENILVSIIDKKSPIEGIVVGTKTPIKLQTNTFLKIQRIQMPMYSVFKINKDEINYVLDNPLTSFRELKDTYDIELSSIYKGDLNKNLYDIVLNYLKDNKKLDNINTNKYQVWLSVSESDTLLNSLNKSNIKDIYLELYKKIKSL